MIRTLLATTALAGLLATSAFAQSTQPSQTAPAAAPAPMSNDAATTTASPAPAAANGSYVQKLEADQYLASNLKGTDLYETDAQDAKKIGDVDNFVIDRDGKVAAVVISTSGLDQNKTVAAPVDKIDWIQAQDGNQRAILKASLTDLQSAPAFTSRTAQEAANNGAMAPGTGVGTAGQPAANNNIAANNGAAAPAAPAGGAQPMDSAAMGSSNGYLASLGNDQKLAEDIIGSNVYSGPGDDAQTIGSVNDLVLTKTGEVPVVVVGVGGFLGIGEKDVGVPYQQISMQSENGNSSEPRLILAATKDQLNGAPTFETRDRDATNVANNNAAATGGAAGMGGAIGAAPSATTGTDTTVAAQNSANPDTMNADNSTTASTTTNDRASMQPISGPELTADNLSGVSVYGPNDRSIGKVGDIALTGDGRVDAIVVDVGGFLGIGSKPVAVAMDNLQFMRDGNGKVNVYTQFTEDQLKNAPEFNRETYAQNRSTMRVEPGNAPSATTGQGNASQPAQ
ncbi:photosystem reaction center subunit H [Aureimonas endophytica]|uniref:Photosystem reaction center subunit H n=1 Tax=Aureimonas endophytica TaxID=2027858 RepID=A0A917A070_9HYPH|nr:PRC-barrel domain-containing protein [Aureimonas endophytica]GGE19663.1 photosystem reaction center subunit H [Aureimonas endophytica]